MPNNINIGIDFSKETFNACLIRAGHVPVETELPNDKKGFTKLLRWVAKNAPDATPENTLFCGEHTGSYSRGLSEWLHAKGWRIWLENPLIIKRSSGIQRVKNDTADARMITLFAERFYIDGQSRLFKPDSPAVKTLRSLYNYRQRLVRDRVALGNAITSGVGIDSKIVLSHMKKKHTQSLKEEKELVKEIVSAAQDPELAANYRILTSFKGIGPLTAAMLIITTSNFTRFKTPREYACYCGVAPFGQQSGTSIDKRPHVSRFANLDIKAALVETAHSAILFNPAIKKYVEGLRKRSKHEGIILNNVKNKIIHIIFKMIETQSEWTPDYHRPKQCAAKEPGGNHDRATEGQVPQDAPAANNNTGGNLSLRSMGGTEKTGATEAAPVTDTGLQTSPSAYGQVCENGKIIKNFKKLII